MGWLKNLLGRFKGSEDEVVIVTTPGKILKAVKTYEKAAVDEKLLPFFTNYLDSGYRFIFFDPEETRCYHYHLKEGDCREISSFSLEEWDKLSSLFREINNKIVTIAEKDYLCIVNFSLTNLGERASILLADSDTEPEILKELKRKAIQTVNTMKPATSLTHDNISNIAAIIENRKENLTGSLHDRFIAAQLGPRDKINLLKESSDYMTLLRLPLARKQVVSNVAAWLGVDYFDVEIDDYDKYSASALPEEKSRAYGALLIKNDDFEEASVAFSNPFSQEAVRDIESILGKRVKTYMACEEDIRYEQEKVYKKRR
ncbi:MAG: hypothetical protein LWY06_05565 [Firmicutes bacterium]|nr:hypothetical protein [Bacillota bacterium]